MDLTYLRYFVAIVEAGNITGAAKTLGLTQPTLTVAMQRLEEGLGTTLLLRGRHGVSLTRTGEELLHHAREVFALIERAEQRIVELEKDDAGSFVVGCHESLGAYFLPTFMRDFFASRSNIEITLWNGTSAEVLDAVVDRQIDFGIVVNPEPRPTLVLVEMFRDAMDLFVATTMGLAREADGSEPPIAQALARLREGPLILAGRVRQCQALLDRLAAEDALPRRMLSCGDLELVKSMALAGVGIAMLPRRVAAYGHHRQLQRLHSELPFFPDQIYLVYRADMHRTKAAMRLKDALLRHGRALAAADSG